MILTGDVVRAFLGVLVEGTQLCSQQFSLQRHGREGGELPDEERDPGGTVVTGPVDQSLLLGPDTATQHEDKTHQQH